MTNLEKIQRLKKMHKEATDSVRHYANLINDGTATHIDQILFETCRKDAAALKYALKGVRLIQELKNDLEQ